jgi:isoquinoline 1-oxidoreductase subunit beta
MSDSTSARIDRRHFLVAGVVVGAGLYVGIRFANQKVGKHEATGASLQPNAFVRVAPDDTVTVIIGKAEMGQGVYTGLAMAVAEELDVDPKRVKV